MASVRYRQFEATDVDDIADVYNQSRRECAMHRDIPSEDVAASLFEDNFFDLYDSCWLALMDDRVVGFGFVFAEKCRMSAGMNDADIAIEVVPECRNEGLQQGLMNLALDFFRSMRLLKARHLCTDTAGWKHDLSLEFSFEDYYHEYTMWWKEGKAPNMFPPPDGIDLEHRMFKEASDDDIVEFTKVNNEFYSEKMDFAPELVESWLEYRDELKENVERITFARDGMKTIGACSCEEWTELNRKEGVEAGYISTLGVIRSYRRRGIGRALLSDAMRWLFERGMETLYLRVDAVNPSALRLYTANGFEVHRENVVYCLELD